MTEHKTLYAAMATALPLVEGATKDKNNPAFKSKYADLGAVIEAIRPVAEHGLWFRQVNHLAADGVCIETFIFHTSGEEISTGQVFVPASKKDAQGYGSAQTYCRRYSLMAAFGIAPEDDDGNAAAKSPPQPVQTLAPIHTPREKLAGPITSLTALKTAIKGVVHEMMGCGDGDELAAFLEVNETVAVLKQCARDLPEWWETGEGMPDEFVPLKDRIARLQSDFDNIAKAA